MINRTHYAKYVFDILRRACVRPHDVPGNGVTRGIYGRCVGVARDVLEMPRVERSVGRWVVRPMVVRVKFPVTMEPRASESPVAASERLRFVFRFDTVRTAIFPPLLYARTHRYRYSRLSSRYLHQLVWKYQPRESK